MDLTASTSNTSLTNSESSEPFNVSSITFPPISTPLPPPLSGDIPDQSPFEMVSPFEQSELPDTVSNPPKKLSLGDAPYSLDDFIDSSPFEPTTYISPRSNSSNSNVTAVASSGTQTNQDFPSQPNTSANDSVNDQPRNSNSYTGVPIYSNNFTSAQPSSSPPISVVSMGGPPRRFSVLKELAPLSSSPPISVKQNPKSAPNSPRNEISRSTDEPNSVKSTGRSNSLNSTYGSSPVTNSNNIPKKESGVNLSPLPEELMETIIVDPENQGRKAGWVIHKPVTKDYQLGSHRKSTAVSTAAVAQLNAAASQNRMQSVKFTEPLRDNSVDRSKWQSVEKSESPKIGKEGVRNQRKSNMLTRSTSASSLPRNSVSISKENDRNGNNPNMDNLALRKNSKTEPTSPLQISRSESVLTSDLTTTGSTTAEAGLTSHTSENGNNNNEPEGEKTKSRRKSLLGKLTRTLSSTFKPLISLGKEKDSSSHSSPANSGPSSLSSSPTSTIKVSAPASLEKRKKRSASDARNKKPTLAVANDRDRAQTVVTFNDMMQRNQGQGPYSANGIFGVPLDILYQYVL